MTRADPRRARVLGLWTAGWLAAFLLAGMIRLGEPSVQWPVLAVPLLWALVALRPRRSRAAARSAGGDGRRPPPAANRTDTVERPAVHPPLD